MQNNRNKIMEREKKGYLTAILFIFPYIHGYMYCIRFLNHLLFPFSIIEPPPILS